MSLTALLPRGLRWRGPPLTVLNKATASVLHLHCTSHHLACCLFDFSLHVCCCCSLFLCSQENGNAVRAGILPVTFTAASLAPGTVSSAQYVDSKDLMIILTK